MHDGVRTELLLQPAVGGQIVVGGRQIGVMVDGDRILPETAGRLHEDHNVSGLQSGGDDLTIGIGGAIHEQVPRGLTPGLSHLPLQLLRELREPAPVGGGINPHRLAAELLTGQPLLILPARRDDRMDQSVAGRGVGMLALHRLQLPGAGDLPGSADVIPRLPHGPQQPDDRHRGVEADGIPDAGVLGGVGRQHDGDSPIRRRDQAQPGMVHGQPRHAGAALQVRNVVWQAVGVDLLEREGDGDDPPIELRHRHLGGDIVGTHAVIRRLPGLPAPGHGQALQDRDIQLGQLLHVPGALISTGGGVGGIQTARGLNGGDDRVAGAQVLDQPRIRIAQ